MGLAEKNKSNSERALEVFLKHNGDITNRAIAKKINANEKTVSVWKYRHKWKDKLKCSTRQKEGSTTPEKNNRKIQHEKIVNALNAANSYSPALEVLIDLYLDCFEEYERAIKNDLETEDLRKEMGRYLGQLGLNINNKSLVNSIKKKDTKERKQKQPANKLVNFRQRMNSS